MSVNVSVYNKEGKEIEKIALNEKVFNGKVNIPVLHQTVLMYQSNMHPRIAYTKNRSAVSGGGKKPWRQKGTGRARVGSSRNPVWRGGGVVFGPRPKDVYYSVPKKIKIKALGSSLNDKLNENNLVVLDELQLSEIKTKQIVSLLKLLKITGRILLLVIGQDEKVIKSARNIAGVTIKQVKDFTAYDVLLNDKIILTKKALELIETRLKVNKKVKT